MKHSFFQLRSDMVTDVREERLPFRLNNFGRFFNHDAKGQVTRPRGRLDYQLIFCQSDDACHVIDGKKAHVPAGSVVLYRPGMYQSYTHSESGCSSCYWLHFSGTAVESLLEGDEFEGVCFMPKDTAQTERLFHRIYELCALEHENYELLVFSCVLDIFWQIAKSRKQGDTGLFDELLAEIQKRPEGAPCNAECAARYGMTKNYFVQKFTSCVGMSPHAYVLQKRLEKSKYLLEDLSMSVSQVAEHVGFFDSKYFCVFFKKHTGLSPTEYRRMMPKAGE